MKTLPAVAGKAPEHQLGFPFNIRRGLGLWKLLYLERPAGDRACRRRAGTGRGSAAIWSRGPAIAANATRRAISPAAPRRTSGWPARSPPKARGIVPNITSGEGGIGSWSEADIAYFLETGFTPDFDSVGGSMVDVQKNIALLSADDRAAIAAYLKAVPPHPNGYPASAKRRRAD